MSVVPKHIDGLCPMLNLRWFNHYMQMPIFKFKTPTTKVDRFSFEINLLHFEVGWHAWYNLHFSLHTNQYQCVSWLFFTGMIRYWMTFCSLCNPSIFSNSGSIIGGLFTSSHTNRCHHYYPLKTLLPQRALKLKDSFMWSKSTFCLIILLLMSKFLVDHVTGQSRPNYLCQTRGELQPNTPTYLQDGTFFLT